MSSSDEPRGPWEPWASAMIKAEAVDPRTMGKGKTPRPSWTQLARLAEVSTSTVTNTVFGRTTPSQQVVQAIAKALNELPDTVSEWLKLAAPVGGPWAPPQEAALLSRAEREALGDFIRAVTLGRREERPMETPPPPTEANGKRDAGISPGTLPPSATQERLDDQRPAGRRGSVRPSAS